MEIYDISMQIDYNMPVYKGKESKRPLLEVEKDFDNSDIFESKISMNMHTGTHIDSPLHMLKGGKSIQETEPEKMINKCRVLDLVHVKEKITKKDLESETIIEGEFVLLKTKNSFEDLLEGEFIYLDSDGAEYLKEKKIVGVGIDGLGIERNCKEHTTHKILLSQGISIIEGLRLKQVASGEYVLLAAPLNIKGAEASPVRALLIEGSFNLNRL